MHGNGTSLAYMYITDYYCKCVTTGTITRKLQSYIRYERKGSVAVINPVNLSSGSEAPVII